MITPSGAARVETLVVNVRPATNFVQLYEKPMFLGVAPRDTVVVSERKAVVDSSASDWFMATVLFVEVGAGNPRAPSLFQVANIGTEIIQSVSADLVEPVMI